MSGAEHGGGHGGGHRPEKRINSTRREFVEFGIRSLLVFTALNIANRCVYGVVGPNTLEEKIAYEKAHSLPFRTLHSHLTGYRFGYPEVPAGWGFVNFDGPDTVTTVLGEELAAFRQYQELEFFLKGGGVRVRFPGINVSSYLDSTGKLVPRITYQSGLMTPAEHILIGHISEPRGSFPNRRPDIIRIFNDFNPGDPTYYVSMSVEDPGSLFNTHRRINVTPLRMVELPKPPGS